MSGYTPESLNVDWFLWDAAVGSSKQRLHRAADLSRSVNQQDYSLNFLALPAGDEIVPVPHARYMIEAVNSKTLLHGISRVVVRVPIIDSDRAPVAVQNSGAIVANDFVNELPTNDIFVEAVKAETAEVMRFLVTEAGLQAYQDSGDVMPSYDTYDISGTLFRINTLPGELDDCQHDAKINWPNLEEFNEILNPRSGYEIVPQGTSGYQTECA